MIGTITKVNKKKTSVQRKFAEIRTFKNRRYNLHRLILQQREWGAFFDEILKERQEAQKPKPRWIFADSFNDTEILSEEVNTVVLV